MQKSFLKIVAGISVFLVLVACPKEEAIFEPTNADLTVYKNQTGDANANALQAQHKNTEGALNFYGNFDVDNNPTTIHTLTYQKANNDTIVHLMMDPITGKLATSYITVNGVKSNIIVKFDYPSATHLSVSFHQYDWSKNTSDLMYGVNLEIPKEIGAKSSSLASAGNLGWKLGALGTGLVVAEVVGTIGGGFTLGLITGISSVAVAAIGAPLVAVSAAIIAASAIISSSANASELTPSDLPYPGDVPINNPVNPEENPTSKLTPFDCSGTSISFKPVLYLDGTIVIEEIKGGVFPYTYMVKDEVRDFPIFPNNYKNGSYLLSVKDANGCISCFLAALKKPANCEGSTLALSTTTTSNSATASATGGQAPYEYVWNNGSIGATINNLTDGVYTVTVTDQYGCTAVSYAIIESDDDKVTDIDGNVYPLVKIGTQTWMAENLKATKFADGTPIPHITDDTAWAKLGDNDTDKAYCFYNNNESLGYGALYTFAAATNGDISGNKVQGVCPNGWHLPSDDEWADLKSYLYDISPNEEDNNNAKAMASQTGWQNHLMPGSVGNNPETNNTSSFTGLAGGYRYGSKDTFDGAGEYGYWWSSTQSHDGWALGLDLVFASDHAGRFVANKSSGCSVRCLKD